MRIYQKFTRRPGPEGGWDWVVKFGDEEPQGGYTETYQGSMMMAANVFRNRSLVLRLDLSCMDQQEIITEMDPARIPTPGGSITFTTSGKKE